MAVTYSAGSPSFMAEKGRVVDVPGWGEVTFDMLWTCAFYPVVDASKLGFSMVKEDEEELVRFAKAFVPLARKVSHPAHPVFGDEGPLSFVIFAGPLDGDAGNGYQRKVCCYEYPPNSVCRSPARGPYTAATVQLFIQGKLNVGARLQTASIFDSTLDVEIIQESEHHGHRGVRVAVTGTGWISSRSEFVVDFNDPFTPGEGLQALLM